MGNERLTLYWHPKTRSTRPLWLLEELGVDYERTLVKLMDGEHKKPAHLAIHPLGKVPVLKHGDRVIFESLAICLYLADAFPDAKLAPPFGDPLRAEYYQWMAFSTGTLEPTVFKAIAGKESDSPAGAKFDAVLGLLEKTLSDRMYLLGADFSAADLINGALMTWAHSSGLVPEGTAVDRWVLLLKERPAYQRAYAAT